MKNKLLFAAYFLVCLLLSHTSPAQIWKNFEKKVGKKIEQQADRRLERKVDKAIDKGFDKLEEGVESKPQPAGKQENTAPDGGPRDTTPSAVSATVSTPAADSKATPVAATYSFTMGVSYRMESSEKKQKLPGTTIWISDGDYIGMASDMQKSMFIVMDAGRMIAFMEDKKTYMSLGAGFSSAIVNEAEKNAGEEEVRIVKTGTETILGHTCDIYTVTTSESEGKIWIAPSINVTGFMKSFAALTRNAKIPTGGPASGLLLKMESRDTKKGETFTMTATEIHRDSRTINTSDYKSMGGF